MDKVSIIIPTYKRADFLERALTSCMNQTYENIEIIVVDDNEPNSEYSKTVKSIISKFKGIIYIKNPKNMGGALSRNEGIKSAKGKFVAFLDDDDEFLPTKIEEQIKRYYQVNDKNCCLIYCYANVFYDSGMKEVCKKDIEGNNLYEQLRENIAGTPYWFCPKDKILSVGGFDDVKCCQEGTLLLKLLAKGYTVFRTPQVLLNIYAHKTNNNSGITNINSTYIENAKLYMDKCLKEADKFDKKKKNTIYMIKYYWIFNMYYLLKDKKGKKEYLNKILKLHKFNIITFKTIFKYLINN